MKHKEEMIRWANAPEGTNVWYKHTMWFKVNNPSWNPAYEFIVDDEWADLRKAQADGEQLEFLNNGMWWTEGFLESSDLTNEDTSNWRIKEKLTFTVGDWCIHPQSHEKVQVTDLDYSESSQCYVFRCGDLCWYTASIIELTNEPEYEWQVVWYSENAGLFLISSCYYTEDEMDESLEKYEPSKRERK